MAASLTSQTLPPKSSRSQLLAAVFAESKIVTPPVVAMKVVNLASDPDCRLSEIASMIAQDAGLSGKLLRTINSSFYGFTKPVASLEQAVLIIGLTPLRSMVLAYSLPVMQSTGTVTPFLRQYWISSVAGAIIAREFSAMLGRPAPDADMTAGLLRNLGTILLERTFPALYQEIQARPVEKRLTGLCELEREVIGIDHADVTAELLNSWKLPAEIVEPIRFHHEPGKLANPSKRMVDRAELLNFVESVVQLEDLVQCPLLMADFFEQAGTRYGLSTERLASFLQSVLPKIDEFASLLQLNISERPEYGSILSAGLEQSEKLAKEISHTGSVTSTSTQDSPVLTGASA